MFPVYDFSVDEGAPVAAAAGVGAAAAPVAARAPMYCTDPGGKNVWPVPIVEDCRCPNIPVPSARLATPEEVRIQAQHCHTGGGRPHDRPSSGGGPGRPVIDTRPVTISPPGVQPPVLQQQAPTQGMGKMWWLWLALIGAGGYYWYKKQGS